VIVISRASSGIASRGNGGVEERMEHQALGLMFGERFGPVREIHAGSGYWSQDSATQVLGTPEKATKVEIRWSGAKVTTTAIPLDAREITITEQGDLIQR
jgi:hypothetical protein